ncbi:MAG: hypothetical protein K2Y39_25410, partial [Candidatus Obscuribacterales bacterium]|nr:hypothetical protein [Candidatus Obscuribacterales bacterium]
KKPETMRQIYVLPEIKITVDMKDLQKSDHQEKGMGEKAKKDERADKGNKLDKGDKHKKEAKKAESKPFNWDSDDPLEGIDVSGY